MDNDLRNRGHGNDNRNPEMLKSSGLNLSQTVTKSMMVNPNPHRRSEPTEGSSVKDISVRREANLSADILRVSQRVGSTKGAEGGGILSYKKS